MASETMSLECPSCKLVLQIDTAFAGGVCRCSNCGTLMTVPRDPSKERAERLSRPDAPAGGKPAAASSASSAAASPPGGSGRAARPDSPRPDAPSGRQTPAPADVPPANQPAATDTPATKTAAPAAAAAEVETGVYVTESGKQIHITAQTRIPTAVKRKALKIGIVGAFVIFMGTMIVLVFGAIMLMNSAKPSGDTRTEEEIAQDVQRARGGYDPAINPYLLEKPNVLGLPLQTAGGGVVVVLDTSSQGRRWIANAADAIIQGVAAENRKDANLAVQVILAREGGNEVTPQARAVLDDASRAQMRDTLMAARPMGQAPLAPALSLAFQSKPRQVILITSQPMDSQRIESITQAKADAAGTQLDVIYLGDEPGELASFVSQGQGQYIELPQSQLGSWFQQWLDQQQTSQQE